MTSAAEPVVPLTRRERQRAATFDEIVEVARRLLRDDSAISLRAVAQEMGMTAPALYRYVDGYDELIQLVVRAIFADVIDDIRATRDKYPDDDPAAQLIASAIAFRRWALANPDEFGLLFASRETAEHKVKNPDSGGMEFANFFSDIYLRVYDRYQFGLPDNDVLPPPLAADLERARSEGTLPCEFPGRPIGLVWVFMRAWSRLYGMVTLEVFGHMDDTLIQSGAMFAAMMDDNGRDLDLGEDWPRLRELVRTEMTA